MKAYYNEFDPKAAAWLKQLIANGLIMDGIVDDRSIIDVMPSDLKGFTRHHFFAGIGGWDLALQLANWPISRQVCTASLPCQPFSVAGNQKGKEDERHLLPHFIELVKQCNFKTIFGEQVPGAIKHGWLDDLCAEMERENYAIGSVILTASGAGAPHIRQRLYWVADHINKGLEGWLSNTKNRNGWAESQLTASSSRESWDKSGGDGSCSGMGNNSGERLEGSARQSIQRSVDGLTSTGGRLGNTELHGHDVSEIGRSISESETESWVLQSKGSDTVSRICNTESNQKHPSAERGLHSQLSNERIVNDWSDTEWIYCRDEKFRPIKSSSIWLVNGISYRMVQCSDSSIAHIETIEKEITNAKKPTTKTREVLPVLQCKNGEEKIPKHNRGYDGQSKKTVKENSKRKLSGVWGKAHSACPSCRRESYEQLAIEFDDVMLKIPQGSTLTKFFGSDGSEYMQTLRKASDESRVMLDSQHPLSKIWESLDDQEKDRVRVHFNGRIWIFTEGLKPLVDGLPKGVGYSRDPGAPIDANNTQEARVMRLKGYGNAVCPQTAQMFIKAFMSL